MTRQGCWLVLFLGLTPAPAAEPLPRFVPDAQALAEAYSQAQQRSAAPAGRVYQDKITPHWFAGNTRFWYRNDLRGGTKEFIVVDAEKGQRGPAFDHARLAAALTKAGTPAQADRLPLARIDFSADGKALRFTSNGRHWSCDLATYELTKSERGAGLLPEPAAAVARRDDALWPDGLAPDAEQPVALQRAQAADGARSPDGQWTAFVKDANVFVRARDTGKETQLSQDGKAGQAYGLLSWAPDSRTLAAWRTAPGERKEVHFVESSPKDGGRAKLHTRPYPLPGDKFTSHELNLFDVATEKQLKPDVERIDFGTPRLRWHRDGRHFTYQKIDRGHQRFRVIEVDSQTGTTRTLIDDRSDTFIWTTHGGRVFLHYLDQSDEILYGSERDGWHHLYLYDVKTAAVKHQVTKGNFVVRGIERVDEVARQVWFSACGRNPDQDPYLLHHYRVNFDGTGLVALTEGDGSHTLQYSPDRQFVIDTWSRADLPPVHELRRTRDGALVCALEKADATELLAGGYALPEVFVAKGRDGVTDIWGLIHRPRTLDPQKKYPVIEYIYAGPHDAHVPKTFSASRRFAALTELGFIVVQCDGMGTAHRSKAFHDVCWHNLKDAGFPDRIRWHQAIARKYPWYDSSRVGIYGTSAGGQNSTGALLFHGDFYQAAVSACGCHDNRLDKASWNEQWMGYPVGPHYAASSSIDHAAKLRGKLLLIVGEMDTNVPPESTLRLVDALIKAGKDFELLVVPGMGHSDGGAYGRRRLQDFFVRHLHGVAPPDRNARQ